MSGDPNRGLRAVLRRVMPEDMREASLAADAPAAAVARGRAAAKHGTKLETWLAGQHRAAALAGVAHVRKVGAPVIVGARGLPTGWAGTGPSDYQGVLRGGRALAVEAKSRERRLGLAEIAEHQRSDLARVGELGGLALLVVELREYTSIFVVPWDRVGWRIVRRGAGASVGYEELALWRWTGGSYLARWTP